MRGTGEQYFLLYETEPDRYLIERMGEFAFDNIEGIEKTGPEQFAGAFYVQKYGSRMRVIEKSELSRTIQDRIVYVSASSRYIDAADTLWTNPLIAERWLPRVKSRTGRLEYWYTAYLDLYREEIVQSGQLALIFPVNACRQSSWKRQRSEHPDRGPELDFLSAARERPNISPDDCFCMQNRNEVDYGEAFCGRLHARESFEDFLTNHMNMAVRLFLIELEWIEEEEKDSFWSQIQGLRETYSGKIPEWSEELIRDLFGALDGLFEEIQTRDRIRTEREERRRKACAFYRQGLKAYRNLYCAVFRAREQILPGIDFFGLEMDGTCEDSRIREVLRRYDRLEDFYRQQDQEWVGREDQRYEEDAVRMTDDQVSMDRLYLEVLPQMSAGEEKMISIAGNLRGEIEEDMGRVSMKDVRAEKTILYVIDEIEREMHLEWSRQFFAYLIRYLSKCRIRITEQGYSLQELNIRVQLILSTHSPFLLSDLHTHSVIELERGRDGLVRVHPLEQKVFAQNIQRILLNDFFIRNSFGAWAEEKLQEAVRILRAPEEPGEEERLFCRDLIREIGEPIVREKLSFMYFVKFGQEP